nr:hypothetical protein BaRGS_027766 [Batillaria attramentaria]
MRQMAKKGFPYALWEWSKKYGRTYGIYQNRIPLLVTSDLDILKEVLVKDFGHFTDRFINTIPLSPKEVKAGVFFAGGDDWKRIRNIITPTFSAGKLKLMEHFINRCGVVLADSLRKEAARKNKADVKEYFGAYTLDVIAGTAFGLEVNSQHDHSEPFVSNLKTMMSNAGRGSTLLTLYFIMPFFCAGSSDICGHDAAHPGLARHEIVGQAFIFFVAGYETTATTLQYLTYNLAMHPDVQERVVREIQQQLGDEKPTYENVGKLKYLEHAIYETLRVFPPVTSITRTASETVTIKGMTIPKGSAVLVPICDVLRDPEYFPDPETFNPDRWEGANKNDVSFLPFGFGPRLCIGMRLALLEIKIAMVHVLRAVKFNKTPDLPWKISNASTAAM